MGSSLVTITNATLCKVCLVAPVFIFFSRFLGYPINLVFVFEKHIVTALMILILAPIRLEAVPRSVMAVYFS